MYLAKISLAMNILRSLKHSPLGLDLYLWLTYPTAFCRRDTVCAAPARPWGRTGCLEGQKLVDRVHPGLNQCVRSRHERTRLRMIRCVDHVVHRPGALSLLANRKRHAVRVAEFVAEPFAEELSACHGLQRTKLLVVAVAPPGRQPPRIPGTRPGAVDPALREKVEQLDLVALPFVPRNGFDGAQWH